MTMPKSKRRYPVVDKRKPISKRRSNRKARLLRLQGGKCAGCERDFEAMNLPSTFDHKLPQALGGSDRFENIELLCRPCNALKADSYPWNWDDYYWDEETQSHKHRDERREEASDG